MGLFHIPYIGNKGTKAYLEMQAVRHSSHKEIASLGMCKLRGKSHTLEQVS